MQDLKVRVWDEEYQSMLTDDDVNIRIESGRISAYEDVFEEWGMEQREIKNPIFLRYTGLKDRNGREIYDGDILSWREHVRMYGTDLNKWVTEKVPVRFDDTGAMFLCGDDFLFKYNEKAEVIGNIYENPELLEEQHGKTD